MRQRQSTTLPTLVGIGLFYLISIAATQAQDSRSITDTLPDAKGGECYAKVSIPAEYRVEMVPVVLKEAAERIEVTEARFEPGQQQVLVRDAYTELSVVEPEYDIVEDRMMVAPAQDRWVRDSAEGTVPVAAGVLADIQAAGVDLDSIEPGQCLYEYFHEAPVDTVREKILIQQASEALEVIPATFSPVQRQVLVKPAARQLTVVPVVYETVEEQVLTEQAHSVWKKGRGLIERIDNTTGEIMCRVDVPAEYQTVRKRVVKTPARVTTVMLPAEFLSVDGELLVQDAEGHRTPIPEQYDTVERVVSAGKERFSWHTQGDLDTESLGQPTGAVACRQQTAPVFHTAQRKVVRTPGRFETVEIPAQYVSIDVSRLAADATEQRFPIVAETDTIARRVQVSDAQLAWLPVLCETNTTPEVIEAIQQALNQRGYKAGVTDGLLGPGTLRALEKFQEDESLAQGGLTYATLQALGVEL